jgi:hypothetical protein
MTEECPNAPIGDNSWQFDEFSPKIRVKEWSAFSSRKTDRSNYEVHMKGLEIAKFWPFNIWK